MNYLAHSRETGFLRLKFASVDDDSGVFQGYGAIFGNVDYGGDIIQPGAFSSSLSEHKASGTAPAMLWAHRPEEPIGRWVKLTEDGVGLFCSGELNLDTEAGRRAHAHVKKGDVTGLSIGYQIPDGGAIDARSGRGKLISRVNLFEVSIVTVPMNPKARIRLGSKGDLESLLVNSGLSKEAAKRVAYGGYPALTKQPPQPDISALLAAVQKSAQR
ncbi:HK97 family phage prohead protease [Fulvimarina sp. MAC3]|uniref:HK97 family phage prohead protease n=1 Tax=Fulvimarina sp. MAC3 TaxID=3148887 RepID=UPI0031FD0A7D